MATGVPEFEEREGLESWLREKPADWAQAIAARSALRAFPLVFEVATFAERRLPMAGKQSLILMSWRATFISWAASKYPDYRMESLASAAANALSATAIGDITYIAIAKVARASALATTTTTAARAAKAAATAASNTAAAAATTAALTSAAAAASAESAVWAAVNTDAKFLQGNEKGCNAPSDLMAKLLWLEPTADKKRPGNYWPLFAREAFDHFSEIDWVKSSAWEMIIAWYLAISPHSRSAQPRTLWGEKADTVIAMQPKEFWEREPEEVLAAIAEIVDWAPPEAHLDSRQDRNRHVKANSIGRSHQVSAQAVGKALSDNREPLLFSLASLQQQIAEFRERVRGDNQLAPDFRAELIAFLDGLEASLSELAGLVPESADKGVSKEDAAEAATWLVKYKARILAGLEDYCAADNVADTTLPVGIILGCGTVGALVAGPMGFGAGAFFGQLVVRHAKPGTVGDKLKEVLEEAQDEPQD
ncbi:hypothetical protein [Hoeflea olei]|uniref:Uncharacterized protein n=1 Tax=Hoeflea olei TaxID=1480615 RepID=A0A1C1YUK4_9HYPH|nr:hypothetical protein [Hoeflea olei]OCW57241.1 hypothetical protein AWJ14_13075 [Hoeflea olei]